MKPVLHPKGEKMKSINDCTVGELTTRTLQFIDESATLGEAMKRMVSARVSSLVVNKAHEHDAYGIITRKDIVVEGVENSDGLTTLRVHDLATKPAVEIQAGIGVKHAVRLMRLVGVRRLLVTDSGELVGIISSSDVFKRLAQGT